MKFFLKVTALVVFLFMSEKILAGGFYSAEGLIAMPEEVMPQIDQYYTTEGTTKVLVNSRKVVLNKKAALKQALNAVAAVQKKLAAAQIDFAKAKSDRDVAQAESRVELKKLN